MNHDLIIMSFPLLMCVLDIVTGYAAAMRRRELNSTVMRDGLWNKMGEVFAIVVAKCVEVCIALFGNDIVHTDLDIPICTAVCAYLALYEITSIIENIGKLNPEIGKWLVSHLGIESYKVGLDNGDTWYDDTDIK